MQRTARSAARGGGRFLHFSPFSPRRGDKTAAEKNERPPAGPGLFCGHSRAAVGGPFSAPSPAAGKRCVRLPRRQRTTRLHTTRPRPRAPRRRLLPAGYKSADYSLWAAGRTAAGLRAPPIKDPRSAAGAANAALRRPPDQSPARRGASCAPPRRVAAEKGKGREAQPPPRPLYYFCGCGPDLCGLFYSAQTPSSKTVTRRPSPATPMMRVSAAPIITSSCTTLWLTPRSSSSSCVSSVPPCTVPG